VLPIIGKSRKNAMTYSTKVVPAGGIIISYATTYRVRLMRIFSAMLYAEMGQPDKYVAI